MSARHPFQLLMLALLFATAAKCAYLLLDPTFQSIARALA